MTREIAGVDHAGPGQGGRQWLRAGIAGVLACGIVALPGAAHADGNSPPVATTDTATAQAGTVTLIDVLGNDIDPDGDALVLEEAYLPVPDAGFARALDGRVELRIAAGFVGAVQVIYRISDQHGGIANGLVDVEVVPGPAQPPTGTNNAPQAVDDEMATETGVAVTVDVLANDTDQDGDALGLRSVGRPRHGRAAISGTSITYTPKPGFAGADSFTYRIRDARGARARATVRVTVVGPVDTGQEPPSSGGGGTSNPVVTRRTVERALSGLGLPTGSADGHYDARTRRALCAWRTVMGRHVSRALPTAGEARAIVEQGSLPRALGSMVTGLNISKTCQVGFWVSSADNYRAIMPATTGKAGYGTRSGIHHVFIAWHVWRYSTIYEGARMYKPMQFSGGQAVHGSAHDSYVKTYPASHGCVRMLHKDIDRLQAGGFGLGSTVRVFGAW